MGAGSPPEPAGPAPGAPEPLAADRRRGRLGVAILGSTGSIGRQTLDVIAHLPDRFRVVALAAGSNLALLAEQVARFRPDLVACQEPPSDGVRVSHPRLLAGPEGLIAVATHQDADVVVVATSGHAAIVPTYRAVAAGKTIALANKETIVCAGELILPFAKQRGVEIRPVDSEHSAIWQGLGTMRRDDIARLILTASGGPFRATPADHLESVTVAEALAHPTWSMGDKVTIDSATLMNKGLEVIEAHWLFDVPYDNIDVLIHPESIVHSLVEFVDGSQIAQMSLPDMRIPIQFALSYPDHVAGPSRRLCLADIGTLRFERPDLARFPGPGLAREAGKAGQTFPTVLSAADDVAVNAFLHGVLSFSGIAEVVARTLDAHAPTALTGFEAVFEADRWARETARRIAADIAKR